MKAFIAGYSVRSLQTDSDWTDQRRARFLIRPEVSLQKSVDFNVWEEKAHDAINTDIGRLPLPAWRNLDELLEITNYQKSDPRWALLTMFIHVQGSIPGYIEAFGASSIDASMHGFFLGFDVADEGLTSALCNCAYTEQEMIFATEEYAGQINRHGLIGELSCAKNFLKYSDKRVPDHSPFYVYSLHADKEI